MRAAISVLFFFFASIFLSNARAYNFTADTKYMACKNAYGETKCKNFPAINKKAFVDSFAKCTLSGDTYTTVNNFIAQTCGKNVSTEISRLCIERVEVGVSQKVTSVCAAISKSQAPPPAAPAHAPPPAAAPAKPVAKDAASGTVNAGSSGSSAAGWLPVAKGVAEGAVKYYEGQQKDGSAQPAQGGESKPAASTAATPSQSSSPASSVAASPISSPSDEQKALQGNANDSGVATSSEPTVPVQPINGRQAEVETAAAKAQMPKLAAKVKEIPGLDAAAEQNVKASQNTELMGNGVQGEITSAAEAASASLRQAGDSAYSTAESITAVGGDFALTANALGETKVALYTYVDTTKRACTGMAEKTGFVCMEGTSQGVQAAKTAMEVAGPVLGVINSAQKSCSKTADVTRMVSTGLTIAKGVCIASKLLCSSSCKTAVGQVNTISEKIRTIPGIIQKDQASGIAKCNAMTVGAAACGNRVNNEAKTAFAEYKKLEAVIQRESAPSPGTSPHMIVKCETHAKDIAMMAMNAIGTMQAHKSAKECEKKLEAAAESGGSAAAITPAQYCATSENAVTTYCKCQRDGSQVGCPGAIALTTSTDGVAKNDEGSSDIRGKGGLSQFAGGGKINAGKMGSPLGNSALLGSAAAKDSAAQTSSGFSAGTGANPAGSSAHSASGKNAELGKTEEAKKWSFGGFGSASGGGSGAGGQGSRNAGSIGQKELNARAIASEKLRAEVSEASGKSNWEKVRERYIRKSSSLLER
ncbi:MAG: hypothetical protein A2622_05705 [Bdellovibrionales bacterium RIFCSPHIGHO2_01_FULL_40_29]|nr:MAG: hypothetical protein A2622_05705 [Bdellovibrionales bacterium RIFCSPHIGHO2_01_FULL_40_29]